MQDRRQAANNQTSLGRVSRVQPMAAFRHFPLAHWAYLEEQQRLDWARSPGGAGLSAILGGGPPRQPAAAKQSKDRG
jgi:hypothetical protein